MFDSWELKYFIEDRKKHCRGSKCHCCKYIELCDLYNHFGLKYYNDIRVDAQTRNIYIGNVKVLPEMTVELITPHYGKYTYTGKKKMLTGTINGFYVDECLGRVLSMRC